MVCLSYPIPMINTWTLESCSDWIMLIIFNIHLEMMGEHTDGDNHWWLHEMNPQISCSVLCQLFENDSNQVKGSTINHLGGAWCKSKKKTIGGTANKKFVRRFVKKNCLRKYAPRPTQMINGRTLNSKVKNVFFYSVQEIFTKTICPESIVLGRWYIHALCQCRSRLIFQYSIICNYIASKITVSSESLELLLVTQQERGLRNE